MKENSPEIEQALYDAEKRAHDFEKIDQNLTEIDQREGELHKFIKEKSESLAPASQELIQLYTLLAREFERQMNKDQFYEDKEVLLGAAKSMDDFVFQAGEKLAKLFVYEKYEPFMERFRGIKEQIKAIIADAETLSDNPEKFRHDRKTTYLIQNIRFQYQALRDLTHDMYQESLITKDDTESINLPGQITTIIQDWEKESYKKQ